MQSLRRGPFQQALNQEASQDRSSQTQGARVASITPRGGIINAAQKAAR